MEPSTSTPTNTPPARNWLELPRDVALTILIKLGTLEILETAQFVCSLWYNLCKDPSVWRHIKMQNLNTQELQERYEKMLYKAVGGSFGGLISLDVEGFGSDDLVSFVAERSSQLKHMRLARCNSISADALAKALRKLTSLEELELALGSFTINAKAIRCCPSLKTFKLINPEPRILSNDEDALAIAETMPGLCHLQLIGNSLTDYGLKAILDGCPRLQSLDLRGCLHVVFAGNLRQRCTQQIRDLHTSYEAPNYSVIRSTDYDDNDFYQLHRGGQCESWMIDEVEYCEWYELWN